MTQQELKRRTKDFSIRIVKMTRSLKGDFVEHTLGKQILRSGTSVGANYRAACIAKSSKDFLNKLKIVEEELDETIYWFEILTESGIIKEDKIKLLKDESEQLFRIITQSILTLRKKYKEAG